ncbi:NAD(P)-dependent alcohol dehydrogenase [Pseudomonas sp. MRSN 12121]|uniref:NAD(P)-dependent alcohol dehydrogenase n=1 Tax=Pseudomonas sp. MRSN 12121 TaxID=1611770 RepID=UPI0005BEA0AD|nr:NAD(P)-dependent alcohol dehydrogenase [Pseudomonas sp. MRSN 12121]AJO78302.1 alcohol dehydrogenase [Pseudomonas sp. MRSN 12121]
MKILAAVTEGQGPLFDLRHLRLGTPRSGEVLVKIIATGICHTDLAVRDRQIEVTMPVVLGHEGAGVITQVGDNVGHLRVGDKVILSLGSCGQCSHCASGLPTYCDQHFDYNWKASRADGTVALDDDGQPVHSHFFGQSSFASHAVVSASSVIKVAEDVPLEFLGPFGCGIMTGAGAVMNTLKPAPGTALVVFGMGAVGLSAVMAARAIGCYPIIVVDRHPSRLALAEEVGASHLIDANEDDPVQRIMTLTAGRGVPCVLECAGHVAVMADAVKVLEEGGQALLTGVVAPGTPLPLDIMHLIRGRSVRGSIMGDAAPSVFLPRLVALFQQGRFPVDKMMRFYDLRDINLAVSDLESGSTIKAVLRMPH